MDAVVFIVDDDEAVLDSLALLIESTGLSVQTYDSAEAFLAAYQSDQMGCLILDVKMPGIDGMELQKRLQTRNVKLPIIFITGHGDVPMAVDAMRAGAVDFISKPFEEDVLLARIDEALKIAKDNWHTQTELDNAQQCYARLTPREKEVMTEVVAGKMNKIIAADLDMSQRTVEVHRRRVMEKMEVKSLADLVRLSALLDINV